MHDIISTLKASYLNMTLNAISNIFTKASTFKVTHGSNWRYPIHEIMAYLWFNPPRYSLTRLSFQSSGYCLHCTSFKIRLTYIRSKSLCLYDTIGIHSLTYNLKTNLLIAALMLTLGLFRKEQNQKTTLSCRHRTRSC